MYEMKETSRTGGCRIRRGFSLLWALSLFLPTIPECLWAMQDPSGPPASAREPEYTTKTPPQLKQLVAPIALYPDSLVAQILSAATFPEQVVEADRWLQAHPDLKGDALAKAVDQESWDPSVKALTAFPSVLGNMDKNLSWTSTLGDTYYNQQQDVMATVQVLRQEAEQAGSLKTTQQEVVKTEGSTIVVEPANPEVVYVPAYDPWAVYGVTVVAYPGWYEYPGIWYSGTYVSYGVYVDVGFYYRYGWGWHYWGCDWHHRYAEYHHDRYYSRSRAYYRRSSYYRSSHESSRREEYRGSNRSSSERGNASSHSYANNRADSNNHANANNHAYANDQRGSSSRASQDTRAARGYGDSRGQSNTRTGGFSNYNHGGEERSYSSRGRSSVGGGGGFQGGGGFRGGGGFHR